MPGFWMNETSGVLKPAVEAYLMSDAPLSMPQVAAIRAYLRQWIDGPWYGENIALLRATVGSLRTRKNIDSWLEVADRAGIDPL
jgi:hypothetical protein